MSRAGNNIRKMALRRRFRAIQLLIATALLAYLPFAGKAFIQQLALITKTVIVVPAWLYLVCFSMAALTLWSGLPL